MTGNLQLAVMSGIVGALVFAAKLFEESLGKRRRNDQYQPSRLGRKVVGVIFMVCVIFLAAWLLPIMINRAGTSATSQMLKPLQGK
jgi:hypothetical protein